MAKHPDTKTYVNTKDTADALRQSTEFETPNFDVYSWSPEPPGALDAKCTQVHLFINCSAGRVLLRFKSAVTLDGLLAALMEHREGVFGKVS